MAGKDDNGEHSKPETVQQVPRNTAERRAARGDSTLSSPFGPSRSLEAEELPAVSDELYEIRGEFARGGLGRILEARDTRLRRVVAVKELVDGLPVSRARFAREALLTARLQHPSIIPVHEAGSWPDGKPFYTMKLVDGESLAGAVEATHSFEQRMALLPHVLNVADAIAYAHSQHIIHRDLKPANVLVGKFGETVVIDWGLAKDLSAPDAPEPVNERPSDDEDSGHITGGYDTSDGAVIGTPAYMPPEQAAGEPVDERADVYALGALLYHVIAGKRPYADVPGVNLLVAVETRAPTSLSDLVPEAPADLVAIVEKAMARQRDHRYATAKELAEELQRYTTGRLVGAHRYSSLELLRRFVARHKPELITASAAFFVLVAFGAWSFLNIRDERNKAQDSAAAEKLERAKAQNEAVQKEQAREVAERTANQLRVEKARALLSSDPTAAVEELKQLTELIEGAPSIAAAAAERGVSKLAWRHPDRVRAVAFSPAGIVASSSDDGTVLLTEVATGNSRPLRGHDKRVPSLAFSADGTRLVTGGYDRSVRVWDVATGTGDVLFEHRAGVVAVAISRDGTRVGSLSQDGHCVVQEIAGSGTLAEFDAPVSRAPVIAFSRDGRSLALSSVRDVRVWSDDAEQPRVLSGHTDDVTAVVFVDETRVASASRDRTVRIWGPAPAVLRGHRDPVLTLAVSPDGGNLASGDEGGSVRRWNVATRVGTEIGRHRERVTAAAYSPDGSLIATSSWDQSIRLWSVEHGHRHRWVLDGHDGVVSSIAFSADGKLLASGSWDGSVRVWPVEKPNQEILRGHTIGVKTVAFSPTGEWLASGAHDDTVRLWNRATGEVRVLTGHTDNVFRVVFSPSGARLASSSDDRTVRIWDVATGAVTVLRGHTADVEELQFSGDGSLLISGAEDKTARIWDVATGAQRALLQHDDELSDVALAPDGSFAVTATKAGVISVWHDLLASPTHTVIEGPSKQVNSIDLSPDGRHLAAASADGTLRVWTITGGEPGDLRKHHLAGAQWVRFSPDGQNLGVAGARGTVWVCTTQGLSCRDFVGHDGMVWDVEFSPDGTMLATAGADAQVRVWDVATRESLALAGHEAEIFDVAFSADGKQLASAGGDGDIIVWVPRVPPPADQVRALLDRLTSL